jgi:3-dehydrosphinganine reductase
MGYYDGKLVLITGGSSGIGLSLAKQLAALDANVFILARRPEQLGLSLKEIQDNRKSPGQKFGIIQADVTNEQDLNAKLDTFIRDNGVPDILINSAGVTRPGIFGDLDTDIFRWNMDVNYFGSVYMLKKIVPGMIQRHSGHIINLSSAAGYVGAYGYTAYCGSKFAIYGLSDALRQELKEHNIRVSVVMPPDTNTPQLAGEEPYKPAITKAMSEDNAGVAQPEDVAREIINGAARGKYLIICNGQTKLLYNVINVLRLFNLYNPFMDMLVNQARNKVEKQSNRQISS